MEERERRGEDGTICHVSAFGFVIRCFLHLWFVCGLGHPGPRHDTHCT